MKKIISIILSLSILISLFGCQSTAVHDTVAQNPQRTEQSQSVAGSDTIKEVPAPEPTLYELAEQILSSYYGTDSFPPVMHVEEFRHNDVESKPCDIILFHLDTGYLAYNVLSQAAYEFTETEVSCFSYNGPLTDERTLCNYLLWVSCGDVTYYLNEQELRFPLSEEGLNRLNSAAVPSGQHTTATAFSSDAASLPEIFSDRLLSDDAIRALGQSNLAEIRTAIATPADFTAWLDTMDTQYFSNITCDSQGSRNYDPFFCFDWCPSMIGAGSVASLAQYVLEDDFEDIRIILANMDYDGGVILAGNLIVYEGKQYLLSLDESLQVRQNANCMNEIFAAQQIESLDDIVRYCGSASDISTSGGKLLQAFSIQDGTGIVFSSAGGILACSSPSVSEFYHNPEAASLLYERDFGHIKPENIQSYQISQVLGGVTLSAEEAYALVGAAPETIREKVHTAADVLMYMLAAQISDCGGDRTMDIDGQSWHYNLNAQEVIEQRQANCGASANLARYLLDGDYEEIGFILHAYYLGNGGGHVYNYILQDGKYYIVDFSWFIFANYRPENDFPVLILDDLSEYADRVNSLYGGVSMILSHASEGQHFPNVFGEDRSPSDNGYYIPAGTAYRLLYQATDEGAYQLRELPLKCPDLDWTVFWNE